ncbi:hypothetical protein LG634_25695 [Streptomyces bambusae]|uniref:hypothetical protein n=1 Tax=Streptomyces bambusae TaxID=1550616 RepID=UPI001CFCB427|nr:hypothetical protein [Streptomyces bambusae]MCB5168211.1 hypothetical protein [Streptomyces bambusae]
MSTATFTPVQGGRPSGATATSSHRAHRRRNGFGGVLHAARVFAGAAVGVVLLGEFGEEADIVRR